ncbi:phosphorylase [Paeniclostridium sordellii]|uniref:nucleoside phosphorylase n=1 Tax=Paraclostridium sordellii TaxID=1505 RepID=UPI0012EDB876|nr:nucleoside phosphorylase [Paeniclostridium sordellii]MDU2686917.1 nucleoside phosphorylase [Paeniclostridium sordellii]MDU6249014.1 nucleoside phosphorylase [Paeniclostridium sordellii]MVO72877.1 phosphorylase [Paeniclostridium sordellii]
MSILIKEFDNARDAIIEPSYCSSKNYEIPEIAVATFSYKLIEKFSKLENVKIINELKSSNGNRFVYKINYKGTDIAFFLARVGAPACTVDFEEIIAMGIRKLVLFGSCGVLNKDIPNGHIIVPTSAIRDEGTSYHYIPSSDEIKLRDESIKTITNTLDKIKYPYIKGKTWTTDAPYRETITKLNNRKKQGCIAVEMECASMAAVAQFRNIQFAQFLYSADNLDAVKWEPRGLGNIKLSQKETYMAIALECAINL